MFFKLFEDLVKKYNKVKSKIKTEEDERTYLREICNDIDFNKVFNFLFETMRGLLIYAKEGDFDKLFIDENLIP